MEVELLRSRIEKEIKLCNDTWEQLDNVSQQCLNLEGQLLMNSDDQNLIQQYEQSTMQKGVFLRRANDLQIILENFIDQYQKQCQQQDTHTQALNKIQNLYKVDIKNTENQKFIGTQLVDNNQPIRFSQKTFEDFYKDFEKRLVEFKPEYDLIKNKNIPLQKQQKKEKYQHKVPLQQKVQQEEELTQKQIAHFKEKILHNLREGKLTDQNIYKELAEKRENEKIKKILEIKEKAFRKSKVQAQQLARDLAQRDFDFQVQLAEAKKQDVKAKQAESKVSKDLTYVQQKGDFTQLISQQYVNLENKKFISQQIDITSNKFGLGLLPEQDVLKILNMSKQDIQQQYKQDELQQTFKKPVNKIDDILGVSTQQTVSKQQSRPPSQAAKQTAKKDDKKKKQEQAQEIVFSESDDEAEVKLNVQYKQIVQNKKHIPIMHGTTTEVNQRTTKLAESLKKSLQFTKDGIKIGQILQKTCKVDEIEQLIEDSNGKTQIIKKEVELHQTQNLNTQEENQQANQVSQNHDQTSSFLEQRKMSVADQMKNTTFKPTRNWNTSDPQLEKVIMMPENVQKQRIEDRIVFVSVPAALNFYNFEPMNEMKQTFTVTNNSSVLQSFKLLGVNEKYHQMFEVLHTPPGMMAPGDSLKISIKFNYNDQNKYEINNISTNLTIRYNGGEFLIPINCYRKQPKVQLTLSKDEMLKWQKQYFNNEKANQELDDNIIQQNQEFQLKTLNNGESVQTLYILNQGQCECRVNIKLNQIIVDGQEVETIDQSEIDTNKDSIDNYKQRATDVTQKITAEFENYKLLNNGDKKDQKIQKQLKGVTFSFDYSQQTDESIQQFIDEKILEQLGQEPKLIDPLRIQFKKLITFNTNQNEQRLININNTSILVYDNKQFNYKKLKTDKIEEFKLQAQQQAQQQAKEQINVLKEAEQQEKIKNSKKPGKKETPTDLTSSLMNDDYFNQQVKQLEDELFLKACNQFEQRLDIYQEILNIQSQNDNCYQITIPVLSVLAIEYTHSPKQLDFKDVVIKQEIQLLNKRQEVEKQFLIQGKFLTFSSPIKIIEQNLDYQYCFYQQQYNQIFNIQMIQLESGLSNITRNVQIIIPKTLQEYTHIDQTHIVMNLKQPKSQPKLSLNIPSKEKLTQLKNMSHEEWSGIKISPDQYSPSTLELGGDQKAIIHEIEKLNEMISKFNTDLTQFEKQKLEFSQKLVELEQQQNNPKQKAPAKNQPIITIESVQQQIDETCGKIADTLLSIENVKDLIVQANYNLEKNVFVGSYIELQFNIQLKVSQQPEILLLPISIKLTTNEISTNFGQIIDLQQIYVNYQTSVPIKVMNHSCLAQHVGVLIQENAALRNDLRAAVAPFGGVQLLYPGQTANFYIILNPIFPNNFTLNTLVNGEFQFQQNCALKFKAIKQSVQVIQKQIKLAEISVNDINQQIISLQNLTTSKVIFTVTQTFLNFINQEFPELLTFAPCCEQLDSKQKKDIQITFNMSYKNVQKLINYCNKQEKPLDSFNFVSRIIQKQETPFLEFFQFNVPLLLNNQETIVFSLQFVLRGPIVSCQELNKTIKNISRPSSQAIAQKPKTPDVAKKTNPKDKKQVMQEVVEVKPEEPVIHLNIKDSKILLDFGQCPFGSTTKKQVQLQCDELTYILEKSVPYYDADITMKSVLHKKLISKQKTIVFEFIPQKLGIQEEVFLFECYGDKECKLEKQNNMEIRAIGEGINIQLDVQLQNCCGDILQTTMDAKETAKAEKQKPNQQNINYSELLNHYCKPFKLNQTQQLVFMVKNIQPNFKFYVQTKQINQNQYFKTQITYQNILLEEQVLQVIIDIQAIQQTNELQKLEFLIKTGNFEKHIDVFCFCTSYCAFFKYNQQIYGVNLKENAQVVDIINNQSNQQSKITLQCNKFEILKLGDNTELKIDGVVEAVF